jgi:hypothetical protein
VRGAAGHLKRSSGLWRRVVLQRVRCRQQRVGMACLQANCSHGAGFHGRVGLVGEDEAAAPAIISGSTSGLPSFPDEPEGSENVPSSPGSVAASGRMKIILLGRASPDRRQCGRRSRAGACGMDEGHTHLIAYRGIARFSCPGVVIVCKCEIGRACSRRSVEGKECA